MARINIEDQFWIDLLPIISEIGDHQKAVGQAICFFKLAQEKHKYGKLVSEAEFARGEFSESLIGVFAERVDGGIQAFGAEKHFGWLAKRVEAGRNGAKVSNEKRWGDQQTSANVSKSQQTSANVSKRRQLSPSPSYSSSIRKKKEECASGDALHPFALIWNEEVKSLPKVKAWNKSRSRCVAIFLQSWKQDDWATLCNKVEASDFLSGRSGKWGHCSFDWAIKPASTLKIFEGNYEHRGPVPVVL